MDTQVTLVRTEEETPRLLEGIARRFTAFARVQKEERDRAQVKKD